MNVTHLNLSDYSATGGCGITMHRLHHKLREMGVDSRIICKLKELNESQVILPKTSALAKGIEFLLYRVEGELGLNGTARILSALQVTRILDRLGTDVVHMNCLRYGFLSYLAMPWLTKGRAGVYTLHDMWALTGHCDYSLDCERWKTGCGSCPYPNDGMPIKRDATRLEWKLKQMVYSHSNVAFVAPSRWMENVAKASLLRDLPIHYIPPGVDTRIYRPHGKEASRSVLGLDPNKLVLMFGAYKQKNRRKGGDLLVKALQSLPASLKKQVVLLTMGSGDPLAKQLDIPVYDFGYLRSDYFKAILYSAADAFIFPTRDEVFGLVGIESLACGTPVIGFAVGGLTDYVRPLETGLLAEPENVDDLRDQIVRLLEDEALRHSLAPLCRKVAVEEFDLDLYAERHLALYTALTSKQCAAPEPGPRTLAKKS